MYRCSIVFTVKELMFIVISILLFFQIYLQKNIVFFQYLDEIVTVFCLYQIFVAAIRGKLKKSGFHILLLIGFIILIGLLSNILGKVQTGIIPILTDIGNCFKVFIVFVGSDIFLSKVNNKERIIKSLAGLIRIFVLILFICMIGHEIGVFNMGNDVRYGLRSFKFINDVAGQLTLMFYSIILILTADLQYGSQKRKKIFIILALIVWASTLRSRAFMYIIIYIFLYRKMIIKGEKFKFNIKNGILILFVLLIFGMNQFETYFSNEATARSNLMRYGIYTLLRFFPLGSGFATFGTDAAYTYYSSLYVEYGFDRVFGLSQENGMFSHDTYWAAIFAQFGVIGTILVAFLILLVCREILKRTRYSNVTYLAGLFICITQVSSSIATATFFHFVTVGTFFLVPLLFQKEQGIYET